MNHSQSATLLARARPGSLVTIRRPDGSTVTGRAYLAPEGLFIRSASRFIFAVTRENIIRTEAS